MYQKQESAATDDVQSVGLDCYELETYWLMGLGAMGYSAGHV